MDCLRRYRTIWLAGAPLCAPTEGAAALLDFLQHNASDYLYVAASEAMGEEVLRALRRRAAEGVRIVCLCGERARGRAAETSAEGGPLWLPHALHTTADDRQLLVLRADALRGAARYAPLVARLGAWSQPWAARLARWQQALARMLGWPDDGALLDTERFAEAFEAAALREALVWDVEGVVCSHARPAVRVAGDRLYASAGHWPAHRTALAEHTDGRLEVLRWAAPVEASSGAPPARRRSGSPAPSGLDRAARGESA